ncbi:MAG: hydrogenase 3 maturation endopeptidase HyCI [Candidatus Aminicenantales bacterium]|jgi:hydrogenase maturation protease HycI
MDEDWKARLASEIRGLRKLAVLGVGNPDKGDDGAGPLCAGLLGRRAAGRASKRLLVIDGRDVPESQTGPIRRFGPDLTVIVDAAVGGQTPGTIFIIEKAGISDNEVSTHRISLLYLVSYLEESIGSRALVIGVEPGTLKEGAPMTPAVKKAVETVSEFLLDAILP